MSQLNRVILMGHLGADPELKQTADGVSILKLRLATNESWLDRTTKAVQERVEWHDVTVFGARADALAKILHKGDCIGVEGSLRTHGWEKDGIKRWRTEVIAQNVMLTPKRAPRALATAVVEARDEGAPEVTWVPSRMNGAGTQAVDQDMPF